MSYNLKDIAKDLMAGKLLLSKEELAQERLKVCRECPNLSPALEQCRLCSCIMPLKVKILNSTCPIDKW